MVKIFALLTLSISLGTVAWAEEPVDYTNAGVREGRVHQNHESEAGNETCCHNNGSGIGANTNPGVLQRVNAIAHPDRPTPAPTGRTGRTTDI